MFSSKVLIISYSFKINNINCLIHSSTHAAACSEGQAKRIAELIDNMAALDIRPLRFIECDGFCQLLAFVEPSYHPSSALYISSLVKK